MSLPWAGASRSRAMSSQACCASGKVLIFKSISVKPRPMVMDIIGGRNMLRSLLPALVQFNSTFAGSCRPCKKASQASAGSGRENR